MSAHMMTPPSSQPHALGLINILYAPYIIGALWVLGKSYGAFQRRYFRTDGAKNMETLPDIDRPNYDGATNIGYTFRCGDPEIERARVMNIRDLGSNILRRLNAGPEALESLSEDPYERLEDIERVRRELATTLKGLGWFMRFRRTFFSQSSEEVSKILN